MKREEALNFWLHEHRQTMIFSFNRFKKLQMLEHKTKLSTNDCVPFLPTKLVSLPYFYDFNSKLQRLILMPPNTIEHLAMFLGCSHFIKDLSLLSLQQKDHDFFSKVPKEVLSFAKGEGRMIIGNKRPNNNSLCSKESKDFNLALSVELIIRVGACYLSKIKMVNDDIEPCYVDELNSAWQKRLEPCLNKLPLESRTFEDWKVQVYFDDLCAIAFIESYALENLVLSLIKRYEENLWTAFFN